MVVWYQETHMTRTAPTTRREMDSLEIAEFLESQSTGVLSLARGDDGYGFPVSYYYDSDDQHLYLRFGFGPDSKKREYLDASDTVTLAVYDQTDEGWKSVLVEGEAQEVADGTLDSSLVESVRNFDIPYFRIHQREPEDMTFSIVRIVPERMTGIAESR